MAAQALNAWIDRQEDRGQSKEKKGSYVAFARRAVATTAVFFALVLLLGITILKEMPIFWLNAGGFPVWLRELVGFVYYPWLGLSFLGLCGWNAFLFLWMLSNSRWIPLCGFLVGCAWILFVTSVVWLGWNNLANILEGRELHHHGNPAIVE